jgi:hypothetical protein
MPYDPEQLSKHKEAMTKGEEVPVALRLHEGQTSTGFIRVQHLSSEERSKRARKWLIIFLVLAPVSVVCPPHFPWPILMTLIAVGGYFLRRGRSELVLGGEATCPKCGKFQILEAGNAEFPMAHFCSECGERSLVAPLQAEAVNARSA